MINIGNLGSINRDKRFGQGVKTAIEYVNVFAAGTQDGEKEGVGRLLPGLGKRFSRFA
jgi:hypothetical protein